MIVCAVAVMGGSGSYEGAYEGAGEPASGLGAAGVVVSGVVEMCAGIEIGVSGACGTGRVESSDITSTETMIPAMTARPSTAAPITASLVASGRGCGVGGNGVLV